MGDSSIRKRISVALCTFNGERFLPRQLASIQEQTRLPDELVVSDDGSTDQTIAIVRSFASSVSFPVKVFTNQSNLGSTKNFERAIQLCSGDLIALSDQDDIWLRHRIARSEQELDQHPEAGLVFSDGEIVDEEEQPVGSRMWPSTQFSQTRYEELLAGQYDLLFKYRFVTGATVMFRSHLRAACLPFPPDWIHDEWLAAMVPAFAELRPIGEPLIFYRRHTSQQLGLDLMHDSSSGISNPLNAMAAGESSDKYWSKLAKDIRFAQAICGRLSQASLDKRGESILARYQAWLAFASFRASLPRSRVLRLVPVFRRYEWYTKHASGLRSAVKDLIRSRPQT